MPLVCAAVAVLSVWCATHVSADEAETEADRQIAVHRFETKAPPPAFTPPEDIRAFYSRFRSMISTEPKEWLLVKLGLEFGLTHGRLQAEQREAIEPLLMALYRDIEADPDWEGVPSSLEFCFDDRPDGRGQYVAVVPEGADADSPVVVFLHGFGGLFQSQVELISRHLPEAVILAPAYRESWREGSPQYVDDMLADADERLGFELKRPVLVGLSDGGQAAFRIVTKRPLTYRGMASVAMTPRGSLVREMPKDLPVLMINGTQDQRVNIEHARLRAKALSRRLVSFALVEIEADHFLLLTHANQSFALLREFMGLEPAERDEPAPAED